jgi:glycolate oxidase iron-sulfur subunit
MDYSVVQQCMHCGLCLNTCPTYEVTKLERNSPRGRIALMRAIADDRLVPAQTFADEMYFCLGCLACMTACPAGVNYAELFENSRAEIESRQLLNSPSRSLLRKVTLGWLFMDLERLKVLGLALRLYQESGLQYLIRKFNLPALLPKRMRELERMSPVVQTKFSEDLIQPITQPTRQKRFKVALLTGCAQDLMFSNVNLDTLEVLVENDCEVITPAQQHCCGSLHAHNGDLELAKILARRQIDQFPPEQFDAIITNAAGCGSHLKHYHTLLKDDPTYAARASLWDQKVKDIHEWLVKIGFRKPAAGLNEKKLTYHEACHLCHGQKITAEPRALIKSLPDQAFTELPESTWCCGSAGIYNLIQPEMAGQLLDRKIEHIEKTGASCVATGNPGCMAQIENGIRARGLKIRVAHPITLLAEAYRAEQKR